MQRASEWFVLSMCWACLHPGLVGRAGDTVQTSQAPFSTALPVPCPLLCSGCAAGISLPSKAESTRHGSAAAEGTQHWGKAAREKAVSNISQNSLFSSVEIRKRERWQGQQGQASSCSFKALTDESSNSTTLKWAAIPDVHFGGNQGNFTHQRKLFQIK